MSNRPISPTAVIQAVESYYYLPAGSLVAYDATASIRDARSIAVYLLKTIAGQSTEEIADRLHRDKATILFSIKSTKKKMCNGVFTGRLNEIKETIVPSVIYQNR